MNWRIHTALNQPAKLSSSNDDSGSGSCTSPTWNRASLGPGSSPGQVMRGRFPPITSVSLINSHYTHYLSSGVGKIGQ
jgi:hypothetical protein